MNLDHVIKISDILFPVVRTLKGGWIIIDACGHQATLIPKQRRLIFAGPDGKLKSLKVKL